MFDVRNRSVNSARLRLLARHAAVPKGTINWLQLIKVPSPKTRILHNFQNCQEEGELYASSRALASVKRQDR